MSQLGRAARVAYDRGMYRISGNAVRRTLAASALVVVAGPLAACGGGSAGGGGGGEATESTSASESPSAAESTEAGQASGSDEPGSHADGQCGDGELKTRVVTVGEGVELTLPADWRTKPSGAQVLLYPPNRDAGDGFVVVEDKDQSLDQAMTDVEKFNSVAEVTSEQPLDLEGFEEARLLTYEYDDGTFTVHVVAVADGTRVNANMTREDPSEQPAVESCLSTLTRSD